MNRLYQAVLLTLCCLVAGPAVSWAQQTATLQGVVRDAETGEALVGANVLVMEAGETTMVSGSATDIDGRYRVTGLAPGTYDVVARFVGFIEARQAVELAAGQTRTLDLVLQAAGVDLNPVVVTASRKQEKSLEAPASISVLEARELENDPSPSPVASLRYTPGVDIAQSGVDRYQVSLRGFNSVFVAKTYALVDYRQTVTPSLGVNAFAGMPISPLDLAQIEVVRGPGSALYGPGVEQGVIHFITKDPFNYPGTSVMVGGGERSTVQASLRHAGVAGERLGYKVVGYYSQAEDWDFDADDAADLAILCANFESTCETMPDGSLRALNLAERPSDAEKFYGTGTLQYQVNPATQVTATGGFSQIAQVNQANTGENVIDGFQSLFGQLRLQSGGLFAQTYYNRSDAGDTYFYRTGNPVVDESSQFSAQAQYGLDLLDGRQGLIFGADFKTTEARTGGTVHGRNEEEDTLTEYGAYLQSETDLTDQLDLVLAGRLDRDNIIEKVQFSPRAALVFKPTPQHSVRATFNRAFTTPSGVNLFLDLFVEDRGAFAVRGRGAADPFTFSDATSSFFQPGLRYDGVGVPLNLAYQVLLSQLAANPNLLSADDLAFLQSQLAGISGFSQGALGFPNAIGGVDFVSAAEATEPVKQTITNTIELGYKGLIGNSLLVGIDGHYTQKTNFLSELQIISPLVLTPGLGNDLTAALNTVFSAFSEEELSPEDRARYIGLFQAAAESVTAVGILEPDQNYDPATKPELMLTYLNFGDVDYYGADLSLQWLATDQVSVFANYSWLSDNFFDADEIGEEGTGRVISMNAPANKFRFGADYRQDGGFSAEAAARWVDEFEVRSGVYSGTIPSYFLLDLGVGYDFARTVPGLKLNVLAQNVLDNEHRQYIGAPELGRLVMARLTYQLR